VLGLLVLLTGSFWPALIVHGLRNYILRCLLVSRQEYARYHADRLCRRAVSGSPPDPSPQNPEHGGADPR
jgi:hypothetical protein